MTLVGYQIILFVILFFAVGIAVALGIFWVVDKVFDGVKYIAYEIYKKRKRRKVFSLTDKELKELFTDEKKFSDYVDMVIDELGKESE